jgi:hypothetical protein
MISLTDVQGLIAHWWYAYDQGEFDTLATLLTEDVHFRCESDTGQTGYEEFIRCDRRGRRSVMQWQIDHRRAGPFPLRHNGTNIHLTGAADGGTDFASYIFVSQIAAGNVSPLSTGRVTGTVRREGGRLAFAALNVTLDTADSVTLTEHLGST